MAVTPNLGGALDPQGPAAEAMADLWWLMLGLGVAVFVAFMVLLVVGLFRRSDGDQGSGDRRLVGPWIVGGGVVMPLIIIVIVFAATLWAMRVVPTSAPSDALTIDVVAQQFSYVVSYPEEGILTEDELHLPVGRPVELRLTSTDVIHSFWVPELGGKMDMLPDGVNTLVLQADEPGEFISRCAEFCGIGHAHMQLRVVAEPADRFAEWVEDQR